MLIAGSVNGFGNLALITISGNSKFSNLPPEGKIASYPKIIDQSLKLKIMAKIIEKEGKWNPDGSKKHEKEMFDLIKADVDKIDAKNIED